MCFFPPGSLSLRSEILNASESSAELIAHHFLIPAHHSESSITEQLRTALRRSVPSGILTDYTILPTTACNASCNYCYEKGCSIETMSEDTLHDLVDFIAAHRTTQAIRLHWFGGEPLMASNVIDRICTELNSRNIPFHSTITTNGSLFSPDLIEKAVALWKTEVVQITLDGLKEEYEAIKNYHTLESPYELVHENIRRLLRSGIRVKLRLNFGQKNADSLFSLVEELNTRYSSESGLTVYVHPLFSTGVETVSDDDPRLVLLRKKIATFFPSPPSPLPCLRVHHCMADREDTVLVSPKGFLGKCEHYIEEDLGNVRSGFSNSPLLSRWQSHERSESCQQCPLFPSCISLPACPESSPCSEFIRSNRLNKLQEQLQRMYKEQK